MAQDILTYEERRARAPKRIRLTRDEALWQGIELAIQIKAGETGKAPSLQSLLPDALLGLHGQTGAAAKALVLSLDLSKAAQRGSLWINEEQISQCDELANHLSVTEGRRREGEKLGRDLWASRRCIVLAALFSYCIEAGNRTNMIH